MNYPKVLLVDDERDFVCTLAERLELRDIKVDIAFNGKEAVQKIEERRPQLVVLDLLMPEMPGLDVLKWIEKHHPDTEVIVLTGRGAQESTEEAFRLGASDCLMKPMNIDELIEKMTKVLKSSESKGR
ncbi:MAG: response regulator [Pseudomonadota bacterium]